MVREAGTGRPLRGVEVRLIAANGEPAGPATVTGGDGRYKFENLQAGGYGFRLSMSRYATLSTLEESMPVLRLESRHVTDWDFELHQEAVVSGRILDEGDSPLPGIWVVALKRRFVDGRSLLVYAAEPTVTDDFGNYRLVGMAPGRRYLLADPGLNPVTPRGHSAPLRPEERRHYIRTFYAQSTELATAWPFELASRERREFDFRLLQEDTYSIFASITDAQTGKPPARATVVLTPEKAFPEPLTVAELDDTGAIEIHNVPSGKYWLQATTVSDDNRQRRLGAAHVELAGKDADGIKLLLEPGFPILGEVLLAPDEPEEALPNDVSVSLVSRTRPPFEDEQTVVPVTANGSFRFARVLIGEYSLTVQTPAPYFVEALTFDGEDVLHKSFEIRSAPKQPKFVAVVSARGASLAGQVLDAANQPALGAVVVLAPELQTAAATVLECTTDQDGRFLIDGIVPGPYRLAAFLGLQPGRAKTPEFLATQMGDSLSVNLAVSERKSMDLQVSSMVN